MCRCRVDSCQRAQSKGEGSVDLTHQHSKNERYVENSPLPLAHYNNSFLVCALTTDRDRDVGTRKALFHMLSAVLF